MRKDRRPLAWARLNESIWSAYSRQFRLPHCESVGEGVRLINPRHVNLSGPGIHLGSQVRFHAMYYAPIHLSTWAFGDAAPEIHIGAYTILNPGVRVIAAEHVTVGKGVQLATGAYVTDADWHGVYHRAIPPGESAPVTLADNVWVADGARVLKGVTVGENSIVAAGAIVTRDVPANSIVAGNPARVVRELDPDAPATTHPNRSLRSPRLRQFRTQLAAGTTWQQQRSALAENTGCAES